MYAKIFSLLVLGTIYTTLRDFNTFQPLDKTPFMVILGRKIHPPPIVILGLDPRIQIIGTSPIMTFERCFAWILGISPRMTFKVCPRMTMSEVFHLSLNFFKKWQKPCVKALKRSEIECLEFTERERETF